MNKAINTEHSAAFRSAANEQKDSSLKQKTPRTHNTSPAESQVQPIHTGETERHYDSPADRGSIPAGSKSKP